ncbi:hypothetical protein [Flavobacterium defluvii]|uniref:Uncharacterized protein n=1 Tax=Flavobacterium defluvii TaxID=370979 RepID=A0A1M5E764_9FLAO|nr:hypothetical protein [Flavobacterium defluvii]SHF75026.1 hypothetical protein SAMN05443663_10149 [Flavobacterium defluvii]
MELMDIVIFVSSFSKDKVIYFKNNFLQGYVSSEEYYESPKYSSPVMFETENFLDMWNYVLDEIGRSFTFYFDNDNNQFCPKAAIQINNDGSICLVLSVDSEYSDEYQSKLKSAFPNDDCIVSYSYFMPFSREDFKKNLN